MVDFTHFPFETLLLKSGDVYRNDLLEYLAYFCELFLVFLAIKLIRAVHNPTVVQRRSSYLLIVGRGFKAFGKTRLSFLDFGDYNEMVERVYIGWDEAVFVWLISVNVSSTALCDLEGSDDLVLRLLDEFFSFVELSLSHGPLFDCSHLFIGLRIN